MIERDRNKEDEKKNKSGNLGEMDKLLETNYKS